MTEIHGAAWRRIDVEHGLGYTSFFIEPDGSEAFGAEVIVDGAVSYTVNFTVAADSEWRSRSLFAEVLSGDKVRRVDLTGDGRGSWMVDGVHQPNLNGCLDVDIVSTPCTNTHAIRRLALEVGDSVDIKAAWVDVPSLEVTLSNQRYTRLDVNRYEYRSLGSGRAYEVTVDQHDVVVDYQDFVERVSK
jgi:hypothetical protein